MVCACQLVYGEQDIADVKRDVAAIVRVEFDVAHRAFPYAVEIQTDQVAVLVYHRTSGIASRGVVGGDEAYRNVSAGCSGDNLYETLTKKPRVISPRRYIG